MNKHRLIYKSKVINYGFSDNLDLYSSKINGILVFETFEKKKYSDVPMEIGDYIINLESYPNNIDLFFEHKEQIEKIINEIKFIWPYICGEPMHPVVTNIIFDPIPRYWESNHKEVQKKLHLEKHKLWGEISEGHSIHWLILPSPPLKRALEARKEYLNLDETKKKLIELHLTALSTSYKDANLFLHAKSLELASKYFPGKNNKDKDKKLDKDLKSYINTSLDSLFNVANNRINIRHVVKNPNGPEIHKEASWDEIKNFRHDCDIIVRYLICKFLKIPMVISNK